MREFEDRRTSLFEGVLKNSPHAQLLEQVDTLKATTSTLIRDMGLAIGDSSSSQTSRDPKFNFEVNSGSVRSHLLVEAIDLYEASMSPMHIDEACDRWGLTQVRQALLRLREGQFVERDTREIILTQAFILALELPNSALRKDVNRLRIHLRYLERLEEPLEGWKTVPSLVEPTQTAVQALLDRNFGTGTSLVYQGYLLMLHQHVPAMIDREAREGDSDAKKIRKFRNRTSKTGEARYFSHEFAAEAEQNILRQFEDLIRSGKIEPSKRVQR